jgi:hypothetical protein
MNYLRKIAAYCLVLFTFLALPVVTKAQTQMSKVKHVFIILMENHNWTGNNSGASFGDPDLSGNTTQAPYINSLVPLRAHAEQYFNPPGNHPSLPNYLWLEAGTNFGTTADILPSGKKGANITSTAHLVTELVNANPATTWKTYAEPDFGNPDFTDCPLNFNEVDVNHVPFDYFSDTTDGFSPTSANCIAHVRPYDHLATDLASGTACTPSLIAAGTACYAQYNFITPNLCHDGHESVSPCSSSESTDNTLRGDTWLMNTGVPAITNSSVYATDGALFILWDEAEDSGSFSDGPIGMFVLSPFAKTNYSNTIHYDHSSMLKTFQEIFGVTPLLGGAANPNTNDLSDFFLAAGTLTSISVAPASASIPTGGMQQFTATGHYSDGSTANLTNTATWTSSNPSSATINASGLATGVAAGNASITAMQGSVTSNTAALTVTSATLSSISVTPASASVKKGAQQQFTATGTYSDGSMQYLTNTATWASSNISVATINASGLATGVAAGTANITAKQSGVTSNTSVLTVTRH